MIIVFLLLQQANAHIVGNSPWCLANSPVHFECYVLDQERCERDAKRRSQKGEDWQCVPFPMDFRNIPKSGEGPLLPNSSKEKK